METTSRSENPPEPEKDETQTWAGVQSHWFQMNYEKKKRKVGVQLLFLVVAAVAAVVAVAVSRPGEGTS